MFDIKIESKNQRALMLNIIDEKHKDLSISCNT